LLFYERDLEVAPNIFRLSVFAEDYNLQFNHFFVKSDEPMLYHAGMRSMIPQLYALITKLIDPSSAAFAPWLGCSSNV
jgi:hypothetical protein